MFCTKLKELKLSGECPFSRLTQSQGSEEGDEEAPPATAAAGPICTDTTVRQRILSEEPPQRKSSRTRVYLHTLAESIRKLIFPESQAMNLKGQMIYVFESSAILFLGSPCVDRLEDFTGRGLYLSDIPIHNALRDVVLIGEQARAQDGLKKRLGKLKATLECAHQALEEEKKKTVDLLFSIFPGEVAQQLWQGQTVKAKKFNNVTMLFSDIVGFTAICSHCSPMQVITMLNELYTLFDFQCGELDVYKVETIGDAYCVAGGLHKDSETHAFQVALMALKMMELSDKVMSPHGEPIKVSYHEYMKKSHLITCLILDELRALIACVNSRDLGCAAY
ncbi:hypothetical protein GDO81_000519 [Engystomops pustulosus]|uniref:Guanylate cyclase soluble subunit alpha-1 n=1 Tax=Engystomops pustulosus TaxID=76066 RepID=A0AAV7D4Y6_ENGPU|nr:hypothetical protein GDO81_000519 [Engystomops pustulosus]